VKVTYEIDETKTHFLNVDLDVWSRSRLEKLAEALEPRLSVLYVGSEGKRHGAHFEFNGKRFDTDATYKVLHLLKAVEQLPARARRIWQDASVRELNVGVQAAGKPHSFEVRLSPKAVEAAARAGAGIVLTVYAPGPENLRLQKGGHPQASRQPSSRSRRKKGVGA
jgi:hypothetical protein